MPTPFASNLLLCPAQFDTLVTECPFFRRLCITVEVFTCGGILIINTSLSLQNLNIICVLFLKLYAIVECLRTLLTPCRVVVLCDSNCTTKDASI